ncbi:carboxylesterase [Leptodontidium sp. 2 PMI_412]|nr:carboxylesterase [Leptodontidium sp. 2 PMI_412]
MKQFLQTVAVFSALVAAKPLRNFRSRGCNDTWTVGQTVNTTSGPIQGHAASEALEVSEYLGIPFAQPPTGSLRFQPPVAFNGSSIINGTDFGFACIQASGGNDPPQSEDCLTLNIWTKPQVGDRKKAVLVWVYGGAYTIGSSRSPEYNGQYFADQTDVILVSFNYRLNIFGFPGNPTTASNLGLLDMRLALEWIRNNAANFGGDVNRISLFGQSAGAGMIDFYSYAYVSDPIANGFVLHSATVNGFPSLPRNSTEASWFRIAEAVGCGPRTADHNEITECMRMKTPQEVLAGFSSQDTGIGATPAFGPGVDDLVVFDDYSSRHSALGGYLIGNNENEAGLFRQFQNQTDAYWQDFNQRLYTCADAERIAQSVQDGSPSWRYRYFGDFPNLAVSTDPPSGAYHGAELPVLFGTVDEVARNPASSTPDEVAVGDYLRGAWSSFAKDTFRGLLTYGEGWPTYEPTKKTLVRLAFENRPGANFTLGNAYDGPCQAS